MTHRKDGWEKPSKQCGAFLLLLFFFCLYSMFIKMFLLCTAQAFKSSFPTTQMENKYSFGIMNLVVIFIKEGLRSVPPLRQGSLECQTQGRRSRKSLSCIILSQIYRFYLVINPQIYWFFFKWGIGHFHTVSDSLLSFFHSSAAAFNNCIGGKLKLSKCKKDLEVQFSFMVIYFLKSDR